MQMLQMRRHSRSSSPHNLVSHSQTWCTDFLQVVEDPPVVEDVFHMQDKYFCTVFTDKYFISIFNAK